MIYELSRKALQPNEQYSLLRPNGIFYTFSRFRMGMDRFELPFPSLSLALV